MLRAAFVGAFILCLAGSAWGAESVVPSLASATDSFTPWQRIWYAQGWTHPIIIHIPIGVFMAGAIAAVLRVLFRRIPVSIVYYCLLIGALGAVPSVVAGWAWAPQVNSAYVNAFEVDNDLFLHRWGGIAMTTLSVLTLVWATRSMRRRWRYERLALVAPARTTTVSPAVVEESLSDGGRVKHGVVLKHEHVGERVGTVELKTPEAAPSQFGWQFAVVLLAVGMGWVGHEGGELVYVGNFKKIVGIATGSMNVPLKGPKKPAAASAPSDEHPVGAPPDASLATTQPAAATQPAGSAAAQTVESVGSKIVSAIAGEPVDFSRDVWPIFEAKCIYCHGPEKQKGKLRMDTEEASLKGGSDGPLYVAGNAAESQLLIRAHSKDEDEVMPPPKEEKAITVEELKVLTKWVNDGAKWNRPTK